MTLRVATVAGHPDTEAALAEQLARLDGVELVLRCVDRVEVIAVLEGGDLDLLLLAGAAPWFDASLVERARAAEVAIAGIAPDPVHWDLLRAAGCPVMPAGADVAGLLRDLPGDRPAPVVETAPARAGKVVAFWGPKGAPGRSTLCVETAWLLRADSSVLLVDADERGGDLAQLTGRPDAPALRWAGSAARSLPGRAELSRALETGDEPALLSGIRPGEEPVDPQGWAELVDIARTRFLHVLVDAGGPDTRGPGAEHVLSAADLVAIVFRADPVGVKNLLWTLPVLREIVSEQRWLLVANQLRPGDERDLRSLLSGYVERKPVAWVPFLPDVTVDAAAAGRPSVASDPNGALARSLDGLVEALGAPVPARGLLARLGGRA